MFKRQRARPERRGAGPRNPRSDGQF